MSADQLVPFVFGGEAMVRVVVRGGEPWFVATDVCRILGIANPSKATANLDPEEVETLTIGDGIHAGAGNPNVLAITESGLYALIFRSRKPKAVEFRKWVTSEVLPAIRQTGTYTSRAAVDLPSHPEKRDFPEWPLEEMRTKGQMVTLYRLTYGPPCGQWIMPQLGFPVPPKNLITEGRQLEMFTESITITRSAKPPEDLE